MPRGAADDRRPVAPAAASCRCQLPQRHADVEPGAGRRLRIDRQLASQMKHALTHADEPESALGLHLSRVEPRPVTADPKGKKICRPPQLAPALPGPAVLDRIAQPFLRDPIEADGRIGGHRRWRLTVSELDLETVRLGEFAAET